MLSTSGRMKWMHIAIKKLDHGRSDFSIALEIAVGALLIAIALRWIAT
ncbi:MAG: hypothetical protein QOD99_6 [Chthoniobacter sp.]|nr:hypothetical protein [Chthoniobacter sp.]